MCVFIKDKFNAESNGRNGLISRAQSEASQNDKIT